jgi:hypothetical protein
MRHEHRAHASPPWPAEAFSWLGPLARRDLLKVGSLSLSTLAAPGLMRAAQAAAEPAHARAKSVVFLFMAGGVTHIDSLDPKPDAPVEIHGGLRPIDTALPGVQFCETMPCLARIADKLAVVRSYSHDSNDHLLSQAFALSGRKVPMANIQTEPNIGSLVSYLHGPRAMLPGYMAVPGWTRPGPPPYNMFVGGWLGAEFAPFAVGGPPEIEDFSATCGRERDPNPHIDELIQPPALELLSGLDDRRLSDRALLRSTLDAAQRQAEQAAALAAMEGHYANALHLLSSAEIRRAFDYRSEPDAVREAYGRTKIGNRCLLAARLVEAGARFVMVDYGYDPLYGNLWDNHNVPVQNFPPIVEMAQRPYHVAGIDRAFAALISDLETRGLLNDTLVVYMTEFGRTPKINADGGRDHWGMAGSMFFAGAGTRVGQVVGATDAQGAWPTSRGYTPADIAATIYHLVGIEPHTMVPDRQSRLLPVLPEGEPVVEVL